MNRNLRYRELPDGLPPHYGWTYLVYAYALRVDQEAVDRFKAAGPGWQSRMNDALRKAVGL